MPSTETSIVELLNPEELQQKRKQQAKDLALLMRRAKEHVSSSETSGRVQPDLRYNHAYGRLAEKMCSGLIAAAEELGVPRISKLARQRNVTTGAYVVTRSLSYGPSAYATWLDTADATPSIEDLQGIMARGRDSYRPFAQTSLKRTHTYEIHYGLKQYPPQDLRRDPFMVSGDEVATAAFMPNPVTLQKAKIELAQRLLGGENIPPELPGKIHCPAVGFVLDEFWGIANQRAAADPELYAADLERLL